MSITLVIDVGANGQGVSEEVPISPCTITGVKLTFIGQPPGCYIMAYIVYPDHNYWGIGSESGNVDKTIPRNDVIPQEGWSGEGWKVFANVTDGAEQLGGVTVEYILAGDPPAVVAGYGWNEDAVLTTRVVKVSPGGGGSGSASVGVPPSKLVGLQVHYDGQGAGVQVVLTHVLAGVEKELATFSGNTDIPLQGLAEGLIDEDGNPLQVVNPARLNGHIRVDVMGGDAAADGVVVTLQLEV